MVEVDFTAGEGVVVTVVREDRTLTHRSSRVGTDQAEGPAAGTRRAASPPPRGVASGSGRGPTEDGSRPELGGDEELLAVLRGIGSVMFLTSERVIVARDGVARRPRSGIQSFPLSEIRHLRLELGSAPSGRIAVWTAAGQEAVSMFFDSKSLDRAHELIDVARPLVARARRRGQGAGPVRPPSGPAGSRSPDLD